MRIHTKLGDIVDIPLPNGSFAFGRLYNDASIGVYDLIALSSLSVDEISKYKIRFFSGVFDTYIKNGNWKIIGNIPFEKQDDSWPPAQYIQDIINPDKYSIYYKGEIIAASKEEISGLEQQIMRKPEELVELICKTILK